jgi:exopolyphosphatase / guanosine-5'-triphosphate,3'-diphosphate pyrophosphatase
VKVGIIDVGSNTVRLLAAESGRSGSVTALREERRQVGLGDVIERRGRIPDAKLSETADCARSYAKLARRIGCDRLEVVVTAPGRQSSNAAALLAALGAAVGVTPRVLSAESEGRLAYLGAISASDLPLSLTAVCDVGGGSTEIAFGVSADDADWVDSIDTGSLRLTSRYSARPAGAPTFVRPVPRCGRCWPRSSSHGRRRRWRRVAVLAPCAGWSAGRSAPRSWSR